ncbi:MAG: tRNA pseudouridine(55) synthase TruB [Solobacterium sp.]|jgi:tRNA pseudouridine synthase B|uniref:tRNA pseudouridine(55) synthase TruB n=1 Tax=uncultured Solobacterium sp. TaxID=747375 RepID=UPI001CADB9F9|nr:tRNA pseudouridine(55) synthase TruB [uncultured Solobacterium sp.]MBF1078221.1 tRNA pseudouridine(55) synthase TruB [Solobacterium sp.]
MDAVILLNKPAGMTSFDAVAKCRRIFHERKIGHTGTLDPEASGLMIILLGKYTKLLPYCVKNHKAYQATLKLGEMTDTEDIWGTIINTKTPSIHTEAEIDNAVQSLTGDILQVPPMYSALKKDGKKLYEYARQGIEIEREARPVHISTLEVEKIDETNYRMNAVVSSGTYIRTLITDFGKQLDELAIMSSLIRTKIEHLSLKDACTFEDLESGVSFLSPIQVIDPTYKIVETDRVVDIKNGKRIKLDIRDPQVIFTSNGELLAAYALQEDGLYHCLRGLF